MKWRRISMDTKLLSRVFEILKIPKIFQNSEHFFSFPKFPPSKSIFSKTVLNDRGQWRMNTCTKFQVDILQMAEIWHKTCQKQVLFTSFLDFTVIFLTLFLTDFDASKRVYGHFSRSLRKNWPKNIYRSSKLRFFLFDLFTWWPEMTLTCIMVTKHSKWYLQMSETLSMPISWLCLCLTSQLCSPMSTSPKCRTFWLWPDLWRLSWPRGQ